MNKRYFALLMALVFTGILIAGYGMWLKKHTVDPYQQYKDTGVMEMPFVLLSEGKLWDMFLPSEQETTQPVAAEPTQITPLETTISSTTIPMRTEPPTTVSSETTEASVPETTEAMPLIDLPAYGEDESFFDDALFIGDSRMCGLRDYARLGTAEYFCDVGMNIFNMWNRSCSDLDFEAMDLDTLLTGRKYGKIYIALGINECGFATSSFHSEYSSMVDQIRTYQPDAQIVLQSIMGVTRGYAENGSHFMPSHLAELNRFIHSLADDETVFYIDVNEVMSDEEGFLREETTWDGCHLKGTENAVWAEWLCQRADVIIK